MDERTDEKSKAEYDRFFIPSMKDYGSRAGVKRDVIRWAKKRKYPTSVFHKMPKAQLLAIARERGCDE